MPRFRVYERVVFGFIFVVEAKTEAEAIEKVELVGDGEAVGHEEVERGEHWRVERIGRKGKGHVVR